MAARHNVRINDASGEASSFGVPGADLTAGNFTAQVALWDALVTAIQNIIIGNVAMKSLAAYVTEVDDTLPANAFAQRELKWLVGWSNTSTGEKHTTEIACPDLAFLVPGSDIADLTGTEMAAFVAAFEAVVRGGAAGTNTVNVDYVRVIGRNL